MTSTWVYLHTEGSLLFKRYRPDPSDFVRRIWHIPGDRMGGWRFILEVLNFYPHKLNNHGQFMLRSMIEKSNFDLEDLIMYLAHESNITNERKDGIRVYLEHFSVDRGNPGVYGVDYDAWMDWLGSTPEGEDPNLETMPRPEVTLPKT